MKKIIPIFIVGVLLLSGIGAVAINDEETLQMNNSIVLSEPIFTQEDNFIKIEIEEQTSFLMDTGKPMLPIVTKVYAYPLGTEIINVDVEFSGEKQYTLTEKIQPAPQAVPLLPELMNSEKYTSEEISDLVYQSKQVYPEQQFEINKGVGLNGEEHVLYLSVHCCPVKYEPVEDSITIAENIKININYQLPKVPITFPDVYDMVIITAEKFQAKAQELADHKNSVGVETTVETVENILSDPDYSSGRDDAEKIKLFVKDALEEWGIHYVLLFGGRKGQTYKWYVPERRSNNDDGSDWEDGYSSDLYFADIYKVEGNTTVFEDWDSNGNGIFAEWRWGAKDLMDFLPDVVVGRITVRNDQDAADAVAKIIKYETSDLSSWFYNAAVISGDTFPPARGGSPGYYEGEDETEVTTGLLEDIGFSVDKLWTSMGTFTGPSDVKQAFKSGVGFVHFAGHGNPAYWGNFEPNAESEEGMIDGLSRGEMKQLKNGDMLPVVIVGGCHNAQINVSFMNFIMGIIRDGLDYFAIGEDYGDFWLQEWVFSDWASECTLTKKGGSIGTMGNSGLGYGYVNDGATQGLGGWIEPRFFNAYAVQGKETTGDCHSTAITDYINIIGRVNTDNIDRKTIEEWLLIGDPSIQLGGY